MAKQPSGKSKRGAGRPTYKAIPEERKRVENLAACGTRQADIAFMLGISLMTLRKHFIEDIRRGEIMANATVGGALFKVASDVKHKKVVEAAKFWLTHRAGWKAEPTQKDGVRALGKKEAQAEAARTAGQDSGWGDLLMTPPINQVQ